MAIANVMPGLQRHGLVAIANINASQSMHARQKVEFGGEYLLPHHGILEFDYVSHCCHHQLYGDDDTPRSAPLLHTDSLARAAAGRHVPLDVHSCQPYRLLLPAPIEDHSSGILCSP